jgi:hypothetical protein
MSKFVEAVILSAIVFIAIPAIVYLFRARSTRYQSVPKFELLRAGSEIPLIAFIVIIPLSYMWFHAVRYSGLFTCVLAVMGFTALYFSIDFAQKRNRHRREEQARHEGERSR